MRSCLTEVPNGGIIKPVTLQYYNIKTIICGGGDVYSWNEFAAKARGAAMSLVAFCFMGGGGVGTAIGGRLIENFGFETFFLYYGLALFILIFLAGVLIKCDVSAGPSARPVKIND